MGIYKKTKYPGIFKYEGKQGTVYGIDYRAGGKKHREIIGPLLTEAQEKLREKHTEARNGNIQSLTVRKKTTFDDLANKYEEMKKGEDYFEKTRRYYIPLFKEKFGQRKLYQITSLDIEAFKKERKETPVKGGKERSDIAVNREIETLRHMLTKAVEWGMLAHSPFERFKASIFFKEDDHRIRYLTDDEMKRLFAVLDEEKPKSKKNPEVKVKRYEYLGNIVRAALLTGLRKGDILDLKWSDVDLDNGVLFFNEQKKGGRRQVKILNGDMRKLLQSIPMGENEFIFKGPDGNPLRNIHRSFRTVLRKAGIKDFYFHDLRHTSASYMVMRGASLKAVQEHLGHSTLPMTQKYSHLSPEFQRAEVERLDGLFRIRPAKTEEPQGSETVVVLPDGKKLVRNGQKESLPISEEAHNA